MNANQKREEFQLSASSYFFMPAHLLNSINNKIDLLKDCIVVVDMEDSIHEISKGNMRSNVANFDFNVLHERGLTLGLRINSIRTQDGLEDLVMLTNKFGGNICPLEYIFLPKLQNHYEVEIYRQHLKKLDPSPRVISFIETIEAVGNTDAIASLSDGLCFGKADLQAELYAPNSTYIADAKSRVCVAAAKFHIPAIDANSFEIKNMNIVEDECIMGKADGFTGKVAIHPSQISIINSQFKLSPEDEANYKSTIKEYYSDNVGFKIIENQIIAPPFVKKARFMLNFYKLLPKPLTTGQRRTGCEE